MPLSDPRRNSRFIPREQLGDCRQWQFDAVDGSALALPGPEEAAAAIARAEIAQQALRAQQQALAAAQAQGYAEGFEQGQAQGSGHTALEWQRRMDAYITGQGRDAAERMQALLRAFDSSLCQAQQQLAPQLLELACCIARQVLREQLCVNPLALLPVVREALSLLAADGSPASVRLNPDDFAALAQPLRAAAAAPDLQWLADATVAPGGCVLACAGSVVDASLQTRWQHAIARIGLQSPWQPEMGDMQQVVDAPDAPDMPGTPDIPDAQHMPQDIGHNPSGDSGDAH